MSFNLGGFVGGLAQGVNYTMDLQDRIARRGDLERQRELDKLKVDEAKREAEFQKGMREKAAGLHQEGLNATARPLSGDVAQVTRDSEQDRMLAEQGAGLEDVASNIPKGRAARFKDLADFAESQGRPDVAQQYLNAAQHMEKEGLKEFIYGWRTGKPLDAMTREFNATGGDITILPGTLNIDANGRATARLADGKPYAADLNKIAEALGMVPEEKWHNVPEGATAISNKERKLTVPKTAEAKPYQFHSFSQGEGEPHRPIAFDPNTGSAKDLGGFATAAGATVGSARPSKMLPVDKAVEDFATSRYGEQEIDPITQQPTGKRTPNKRSADISHVASRLSRGDPQLPTQVAVDIADAATSGDPKRGGTGMLQVRATDGSIVEVPAAYYVGSDGQPAWYRLDEPSRQVSRTPPKERPATPASNTAPGLKDAPPGSAVAAAQRQAAGKPAVKPPAAAGDGSPVMSLANGAQMSARKIMETYEAMVKGGAAPAAADRALRHAGITPEVVRAAAMVLGEKR